MTFVFSERSKQRMEGIHPDLVSVMALALERTPVDFTVLEGLRSLDRQKQLVAKGASKTMNSRHLSGHAIDIAPLDDQGDVSWSWPLYHQLAPVVKQAAKDLGVDLEWGGDWRTFKDGPHWQLSWSTYAADDMTPRANVDARVAQQSAPDNVFAEDAFAFLPHDPIHVAHSVKNPAPDWFKAPVVHDEPPKQPKTPAQSTTIRAAGMAALAQGGSLFAAWPNLDQTDKYIIAGLAVFVGGCLFWIYSERIKKMFEHGI